MSALSVNHCIISLTKCCQNENVRLYRGLVFEQFLEARMIFHNDLQFLRQNIDNTFLPTSFPLRTARQPFQKKALLISKLKIQICVHV